MTGITHAEWVAALEAAMATRRPDDPGVTVQELVGIWGCCTRLARERLRLLGDRVVAGRKAMRRIDGVACTSPCYRLRP